MSKSFKSEDLTGKQFGEWTVVSFYPNDKPTAYWLCQCSCSNKPQRAIEAMALKHNRSRSCGCLKSTHSRLPKQLIGQTFGNLTVVRATNERKAHMIIWECQCNCIENTIIKVTTSDLTTNRVKSCGCHKKQQSRENFRDLTGQTFNKLIVINKTNERTKSRGIIWNCNCKCGTKNFQVSSNDLINYHTQSCGCIKSLGEFNIRKILEQNNITYKSQYTFSDLKDKRELPFDFGIINNDKLQYLIEFDGLQHRQPIEEFGGEKGFKLTQFHDKMKNEYCIKNNIPLIRIPYEFRDIMDIELLQLTTTPFLYKE